MEASWVCLKPQTKPKDCDHLLYSYRRTYICCEINSKSSSHKEGYEAELKMCTQHTENDVAMPSGYAMRSTSNPQAAEEAERCAMFVKTLCEYAGKLAMPQATDKGGKLC